MEVVAGAAVVAAVTMTAAVAAVVEVATPFAAAHRHVRRGCAR